jgi:hypothetical protein
MTKVLAGWLASLTYVVHTNLGDGPPPHSVAASQTSDGYSYRHPICQWRATTEIGDQVGSISQAMRGPRTRRHHLTTFQVTGRLAGPLLNQDRSV